jgi:NADPH-dependent 2,4-dienoyl-CoA reductase/sulfur reductase-like enzyme
MPYIWNTFVDEKVSRVIQQYLESKGISFMLNDSLKEIQGKSTITSNSRRLETDMLLIAVGITPNVELAKESGIRVDNGIIVNEYLETSAKGIYAAGDIANIFDPREGRRKRIEHWNTGTTLSTLENWQLGTRLVIEKPTISYHPYGRIYSIFT